MKHVIRLIAVFLLVSFATNAYCAESELSGYVDLIKKVDENFFDGILCDSCNTTSLATPWGEGKLIDFIQKKNKVAYAIVVDGIVLEYAKTVSPYKDIMTKDGELYYYDFSNYSTIAAKNAREIAPTSIIEHIIPTDPSVKSSLYNGTYKYLTYSPQLQNSHNCIVAALANIMWYWGQNGYSALTSGLTFNNVKNSIDPLFGGHYANSSVKTVATSFANSRCGRYFTGGAKSNPTISTLCAELQANRPCMVGFMAGNPYYGASSGHMTMCFGYNYTPGTYCYIVLADGWNSSIRQAGFGAEAGN